MSAPSTRSFTPTRQGNPCLVCGDIKGKCRQTAEDQRHAEALAQTSAAGVTA